MTVVRFVVEERTLLAEGKSWGNAGAYERLNGIAELAIDPEDPRNSVIVNLDRAPRNELGLVEFKTPFRIIKPVDMNLGNRKIWYGINNRGLSVELGMRSFPSPAGGGNPTTIEDIGENNILLREGYAVVDAGWQGDGVLSEDRIFPEYPVATNYDGSPIVGPMRVEFGSEMAGGSLALSRSLSYTEFGEWRAYETSNTNTEHSSLTVRDRSDAPRTPISPDRWAFGKCLNGPDSFTATTTDITLFDGFAPEKIYELIYPAKGPTVMGLGYAVTRDIASYLRNHLQDNQGNLNPLAMDHDKTGIRKVYASGTSSTGMYMREFLYLGFNEDEESRRVFDAVTIYSAGTHRLFANVQFAHPTFFSGQDSHRDFTSNSIAPFTFAVTTDPVTGLRDGILKRPITDPLVFQIDEELLFWQWKASLNVVDGIGDPVAIPDNVRLYHQDGFGHIGIVGLLAPAQVSDVFRYMFSGGYHPTTICVTPRALAIAIDEWADAGVEPPESNYPRLEDGTLVSMAEYHDLFPKIPEFTPPEVMNELQVLDFGTGFDATGGIQSVLPPNQGSSYKLFVPRPSADGEAVRGIKTIWTRAPLGSNVGWNLRSDGRSGDLAYLMGSYSPFPVNSSERSDSGDPRLSLQERYGDHEGFTRAVQTAADELVSARFLLPEDAATFVQAARDSDVLISDALLRDGAL